ncbi:MAG: GyrI-like domain-containing protein [Myxococcota bacterium]|nr:GyrI-like domain-containing protein [Myxococcota bacterium]
MRTLFSLLAVVGLLMCWACCVTTPPPEAPAPPPPVEAAVPAETPDAPDAAQILDQAIAAAGGIESLKKASAGIGKSEGVYMGMAYTSDNVYHPDHMRMEIQMPDTDSMAMVMGLEACWMTSGPVVINCSEDEKKATAQIMTMNKAALLWPLKEGQWEVALNPPTGDLQVLGVTHTPTGGKGTLYIDKNTHLLVKSEYQGAAMGQSGTFVSEFSNHKELCGAKVPALINVTFNQMPYLQEKVLEFECKEVNEDAFAAPAQVQDATVMERRVPAATMACHLLEGPYDQIGMAIGKLIKFMASEKLTPMGMPMMTYIKAPPKVKKPEKFQTDICFPVGRPAPPSPIEKEAFSIKGVAATDVLSIYGVGSPETKSPELAKKIVKEARKRKLKVTGPMRQISYSDPRTTPPEKQIHEVQLPIEKK